MTGSVMAAKADQIVAGMVIPSFAVEAVDADHIKLVALLLRDPNPIHFDQDAVRAAGLGDREVSQGGMTMAFIYNMLIAWTGSREAIRRIQCQFRANVFAGDQVSAGGVVTTVREVEDGLEADCDVWADRADGIRAIRGTATVLFVIATRSPSGGTTTNWANAELPSRTGSLVRNQLRPPGQRQGPGPRTTRT